MKTVVIVQHVAVLDEDSLRAYVETHKESWGFGPDDLSDLGEAVREAVLLNNVCPLDIGLELTDHSTFIG